MSELCTNTQDVLASGGSAAVEQNPILAAHFATCETCQAVWSALQTVDTTLAAMEPIDVPAALMQQTLSAIHSESVAAEPDPELRPPDQSTGPPPIPEPELTFVKPETTSERPPTPQPLPAGPAKLPWVVRYHQVAAAAAARVLVPLW